MGRPLTAVDVQQLLSELVVELAELGEPVRVFVFGGAAMALLNPARDSTQDIDAFFGRHTVDASAVLNRIQERWGLSDGWFNFQANGLLPPVAGIDAFQEWRTVGDATLFRATQPALLAMKLAAARGKDQADIAFLLRACGVTTVQGAEEAFEAFYPGEALSDVAIARVNAALEIF